MCNLYVFIVCSVITTIGLPFGIGPSVRFSVFGRNALDEGETVLYEESVSKTLLIDEAMLLPGIRVSIPTSECCDALIEGYWSRYNPCYVVNTDTTAEYNINRRGNVSFYTIGLRRSMGNWNSVLFAEGMYMRESWLNPITGAPESTDSLAIGPGLLFQVAIDTSHGEVNYDIGILFPAFSDVIGRVALSYLLP